jgi:predicted RND superfamily exporter protein
VLVAGFTVLTFSAFALNSNMAIMTAVTIIFAIVADFLLLPPILMALDSKSHGNSETGEQPVAAFDSEEQINV